MYTSDLNPSESVRQEGDVPTCYPIAPDIACTLTHFHSLEILVGRVTQSDGWQVLPRGHDLPAQQVVYLPFWTTPDTLFSFINSEDTFLIYFFYKLRARVESSVVVSD